MMKQVLSAFLVLTIFSSLSQAAGFPATIPDNPTVAQRSTCPKTESVIAQIKVKSEDGQTCLLALGDRTKTISCGAFSSEITQGDWIAGFVYYLPISRDFRILRCTSFFKALGRVMVFGSN